MSLGQLGPGQSFPSCLGPNCAAPNFSKPNMPFSHLFLLIFPDIHLIFKKRSVLTGNLVFCCFLLFVSVPSEVKRDCLQLLANWKSAQCCKNKESSLSSIYITDCQGHHWTNAFDETQFDEHFRFRWIWKREYIHIWKIPTVLDPICLTMQGSLTECPTYELYQGSSWWWLCPTTIIIIIISRSSYWQRDNCHDWIGGCKFSEIQSRLCISRKCSIDL